MDRSIELLENQYIVPLKANPELYIGIELEFPIVNLLGEATDEEVCKDLLYYVEQHSEFQIGKKDENGDLIELRSPSTGDNLLFEVAYTTLEFAFGRAKTIEEIELRFKTYMDLIQGFLRSRHHEIQGCGIHPQWQKNSNQAVKSSRYQMLLAYLSLSEKYTNSSFHHFPKYGAFICGSQVQFDVSKSNYLRVINAFNKIEAAKAYVFANSTFTGSE